MEGDFVSYVGNNDNYNGLLWEKGFCYRWASGTWVKIKIEADGNFESNPYMVAMFDLTENAPSATFLGMLVQNLVAKTAMIEKIFAETIEMTGDGRIYSQGFTGVGGSTPGFSFDAATGKLEANSVDISGKITAKDGTFNGVVNAHLGDMTNIKISGQATLEGAITIESGKFRIVPGSTQERSYGVYYTAASLLGKLRDDLGMPDALVFSVAVGKLYYSSTGYWEFDTIAFEGTTYSHYTVFRIYKNGLQYPNDDTAFGSFSQISHNAMMEITAGTNEMVMAYDAPNSVVPGISHAVYKARMNGLDILCVND